MIVIRLWYDVSTILLLAINDWCKNSGMNIRVVSKPNSVCKQTSKTITKTHFFTQFLIILMLAFTYIQEYLGNSYIIPYNSG